MRISHDDVAQLTEDQKRRLTELWMPQKYDVAIAYICKDVENEEYEAYEFSVGNAALNEYAHLFLHDLKAPEVIAPKGGEPDVEEDVDEEEDISDSDEEYSLIIPSYFNKEDCIPLLNIGQMIEMLERNNFGSGDFYMTASNGEVGCELGKNATSWENYGQDFEGSELCDVLFELVKTLL